MTKGDAALPTFRTDFARRVDAAGGGVTAAVHQWLVETARIRPDAQILHLEVRTWRPC